MTRPYSPYDTKSAERFGDDSPQPGQYDPDSSFRSRYRTSYDSSYRSGDEGAAYEDYDAYVGDSHDDSDDDDIYEYYEPVDKRWMWVASVAGVILLVAVICTVIILGGGDSGSVSVTTTSPAAPTTSQSPTTPAQDATAKPKVPPPTAMSPETVTTVTPSPRATAEPTAEPAPAEAAPPAAEVSPRTVTYTVTGTRPLLDLVTIVYTDQQGALQTEFNVALPWSKVVVLNPGVETESVVATSFYGRLNCSVFNAAGQRIITSNTSNMATCAG